MTWGVFDEAENKAVPETKTIDQRKEIRPGDILLSRSNTASLVGATVLVGQCRPQLLLSDKSMRLLYSTALSPRWLSYALSAPQVRSQMSKLATGTSDSMRNISQDGVRCLKVNLPPVDEQNRIADALDELISDLDSGMEALERAQRRLKLYRASVLQAALLGTLTAQWRANNRTGETAPEMLQRILIARRDLWEKTQLLKFKAANRTPPYNWKSKYAEPTTPDTRSLPSLPHGWCWATVEQCSSEIRYGSSAKTSSNSKGVPVLRMGNLSKDGALVIEDLKFLPKSHPEFPSLLLQPGDILFNRTNSAELVGKTAVYYGMPAECSFASYLIRVRTIGVRPTIISNALNSLLGRNWIASVVNQTVGQANVNGTKLSQFAFPLAPEAEQDTCLETADEQLSNIDHLTSELALKATMLDSLRQSLLKAAFAGNLSTRFPHDESAHALMDRIAAERADYKATKRQLTKRAIQKRRSKR